MKRRSWTADKLYIVQGGLCAYCLKRVVRANFNVDHVIAISAGGSNKRNNLVGSCKKCNAKKGSTYWKPKKFFPDYLLGNVTLNN